MKKQKTSQFERSIDSTNLSTASTRASTSSQRGKVQKQPPQDGFQNKRAEILKARIDQLEKQNFILKRQVNAMQYFQLDIESSISQIEDQEVKKSLDQKLQKFKKAMRDMQVQEVYEEKKSEEFSNGFEIYKDKIFSTEEALSLVLQSMLQKQQILRQSTPDLNLVEVSESIKNAIEKLLDLHFTLPFQMKDKKNAKQKQLQKEKEIQQQAVQISEQIKVQALHNLQQDIELMNKKQAQTASWIKENIYEKFVDLCILTENSEGVQFAQTFLSMFRLNKDLIKGNLETVCNF